MATPTSHSGPTMITTGPRVLERNSCFGPPELGYKPDRIFMEWNTRGVEGGGWKLHISARPEEAEMVARIALPILRRLGVPHKVVATLEDYERFNRTRQAGKFITVYTRGTDEAQKTVAALDTELEMYREFGGLRPGPLPTSRDAGHKETEIPLSGSGFISVLFRDDYSR
jgi:hypothetical protein